MEVVACLEVADCNASGLEIAGLCIGGVVALESEEIKLVEQESGPEAVDSQV